MESYRRAFGEFVARIPEDGLLIAFAGDGEVRAVCRRARCRVRFFALRGDDCGEVTPHWSAGPLPFSGAMQPFELQIDDSPARRLATPLMGDHNIRNTVAALAMAREGAGVSIDALAQSLPGFRGVRRRQQLRGTVNDVRVYDDFAHHPSAVALTVDALRRRHPDGRLIAVFEPRSATASRRLHQHLYADAFAPADLTLLAPVGRPEIPDDEKLDVAAIAAQIAAAGRRAEAPPSIDAIIDRVLSYARPGDTVVAMSNGAFGNIHSRLLQYLENIK
jgi:UDP-N-acetylmuramate: L-alanyl-gamma-D-glutamyl-meso-diaminopimelate ligase